MHVKHTFVHNAYGEGGAMSCASTISRVLLSNVYADWSMWSTGKQYYSEHGGDKPGFGAVVYLSAKFEVRLPTLDR